MSGCYRRLAAQMALGGMDRRALAQLLGISYGALCKKFSGRCAFSLEQAAQIKRALCYRGEIEYLFEVNGIEGGGVEHDRMDD